MSPICSTQRARKSVASQVKKPEASEQKGPIIQPKSEEKAWKQPGKLLMQVHAHRPESLPSDVLLKSMISGKHCNTPNTHQELSLSSHEPVSPSHLSSTQTTVWSTCLQGGSPCLRILAEGWKQKVCFTKCLRNISNPSS